MRDLPIGVFDSGVGGLTVLKALQALLPNESFVYLGDTARLPYGTKGPETVKQYALQATEKLLAHTPVKMLVIACNTASVFAYEALCEHHPHLAIIDVVRPGAKTAVEGSKTGHLAVIATEATVNSKAYVKAIQAINPQAVVHQRSASVLVALAEEGWCDNDVAIAAAEHYLKPLLAETLQYKPDCLVLGCTHFPSLLPAIEVAISESVNIVDSATATALSVVETLSAADLLTSNKHPTQHFLVTDVPERFMRVAKQFLGSDIGLNEIELVSL